MCRSIKVLRRADEPPTDDELQAAARQFVRKISGYQRPIKAREQAFEKAIDDIARVARTMFNAFEG